MTLDLTRRDFAVLLAASAASAALPSVGLAKSRGYAVPAILENVETLIPLVGIGPDMRPDYEQAGMILVDVRTREEYDAGHIPGARHLDPNAVVAGEAPISGALRPEAEIARILGSLGISASRRIVLYDEKGGFHAARMFWLLEYLGHQDAAVLNGGLAAWRSGGGAIEVDTAETPGVTFTPSPMPRRLASADYILAHRSDADTVVIDVRPPELFVKGHIPWAINVPWSKNLGEDGRFLAAEDLRAHFSAHGVTEDKNVVIHCQEGLASSHSYVALRLLGFPRARVYHRSWADWSSDPTLPVGTDT